MSTRTPNYNLHQWVPSDAFQRTDFNEDLLSLDGAVASAKQTADSAVAKAEQAARDAASVEARLRGELAGGDTGLNQKIDALKLALQNAIAPVSYNVYQLMLQRYYEGKDVGQKQALLMDGFRNANMLASVELGCVLEADQSRVRVVGGGQSSLPGNYFWSVGQPQGQEGSGCELLGYIVSSPDLNGYISFTAFGRLNSITLRMAIFKYDNAGGAYPTVSLYKGTERLATSSALHVNQWAYQDYTFPLSAVIGPGDYRVVVNNPQAGRCCLAVSTVYGAQKVGVGADVTPTYYDGGTITTPTVDLGGGYTAARAFVRCTGGTPSLYLKSPTSGWTAMPHVASRDTVNADGAACQEAEYRLDAVPAAPNRSAAFRMRLNGAGAIAYDYGVCFL